MRNIYLSAGHSNTKGRDMGAVGNGFIEGVEAAELRNIIFTELKKLGITAKMDSNNTILADSLRFFKNLTDSKSIVVDIHFNAGVPKATGTETLVPFDATKFEKSLAEELTKTMSETLAIKSRGVKTEADSHHGRLGWMRLTGENVLLEVCFISNKKEIENYRIKRFELGRNIAKVLFEFANDKTVTQEHVVQKGDTLSKIALQYKTTVIKLQTDNKLTNTTIFVGQKLKL